MRRLVNGALLALLLLLPVAPTHAGDEPGGFDLTVDREQVGIGLGFHGATVRVRATVPEDAVAVFRVVGPEEPVRLKIKDRVAGVLWANVGEVEIDRMQTLLLVRVYPSKPPESILDAAGLTDAAIERRSLPSDVAPRVRFAFDEMLKLLRHERRLVIDVGGHRVDDGAVETEFRLPASAPVGDYSVDVIEFRDGRQVGTEMRTLAVRKVGLVALVSRLAAEHGFWYGTVAVVIAVLVGLLTGWVFARGGTGAH